jgi:hypothetical protein
MRRLVPLLMALLVFIACGGGDDEETSADEAAASTSSTTAGDEVGEPAPSTSSPSDDGGTGDADESDDQAIAEEAVLRLSDFEPGWRADEPEPDDDDAGITECEGFESFDDDAPSADSKTFVRDQTEIESSVAVLTTEQESESFMRLLSEESTVECLRQAMQDAVDEGFQDDADLQEQFDSVSTTVGPVSVGEYGDDAAGYQIEATLEGEELTLDLYVDLLVVRQGRALALYSFVDVFTPFSGDRDPLVEAVVDRLAAAGV